MKLISIVLTGAPASGKTKLAPMLKDDLRKEGYYAVLLSETATELLNAGFSVDDRASFQRAIFQFGLERERFYRKQIKTTCKTWRDIVAVLICDRGLADGAAYVHPDEYKNILTESGFSDEQVFDRYDAIFHLQSYAALNPNALRESRTSNPVRIETDTAQAMILDQKIKTIYCNTKHYIFIPSQPSVNAKYQLLKENVITTLNKIREE